MNQTVERVLPIPIKNINLVGFVIKKIHRKFPFPKKTIFTDKNRLDFNEATKCWICGDLLDDD